jgi:thiamine biosynthesis protein ThiI
MHDIILVRYSEIALKGKNRKMFEGSLIKNMQKCLKANNVEFSKILRIRSRIIVYSKDDCSCLAKVFGISSISPAVEINADMETIREEALKHYTKGTFRVSSQRMDKKLQSSIEMNKDIGAYIVDKTNAKVSLKSPDVDIGIEIVNNKAYIFSERIKGVGGLPVGVTGVVGILVEDNDYKKVAYKMMKRGCNIILITKNNDSIDSCGIKIQKVDSAEGLPDYVIAIATSEKLSTLKSRKFNLPVLRPLITD